MADDVRNTSSFPNYEAYGQSPVYEFVQPGPTPGVSAALQAIRPIFLYANTSSETLAFLAVANQ